jgi:predicted Zn-dependent peptidase
MNSNFAEHVLPNGLRVVCETLPGVRSAAVAVLARTGARHESPPEHGVSHFLEHMCFKGTARRTAFEVNVGFDELGSIYNAFTSREHTVYYGWVPAGRIGPQFELLSDMMRPALPKGEFETERKVVLEEIAMTGDEFDHHVSDFLHRVCFGTHPLAHEILGEKETIAALKRERMVRYHAERYAPQNLCVVAAGALEAEALLGAVGRYCGGWRRGPALPALERPGPLPTGVHKLVLPQFQQQSIMIAYPSVAYGGPHDETIEALAAVVGGVNSRCYWDVVQKGICTQAGLAWLSYADCGLLVFYADGEPERCEAMYAALREQIGRLVRAGVTAEEVQRVKNRQRTRLALEAENPRTRIMQIVDDLESGGYVRSAAARLAAVEAVTPRRIAAYLAEHPIGGEGLVLSVGPRDWGG